ncbi:hypothetical protein LMJ38_16310 [Streptomyces sp. R1]|uniref:WXG100-like domain-containing protein n=1 Tax=Streptomyces sp. R1 TaxID=1509279 RepID=UPI001E64C4C2|nr:hypothetical protein [Streptomyces sp. R1]MCC8337492.1 hypothetical protein [Streptomyces sp. R1]
MRRGQGYTLCVSTTQAIHRQNLARCQPLDCGQGTPTVPAQRKARREYENRVSALIDLVGVQWPDIDEDEVRDTAKDYRNLAEGILDAMAEGNKACSHIVGGRSKGKTVDTLDRRWGKLTTKDLSTFAKSLDEPGDALDDCAGFIEGCKVACIAELTATTASATAGVIGMFCGDDAETCDYFPPLSRFQPQVEA